MDIEIIRTVARESRLIFTDHVVRQMAKRDISDSEVVQAILTGVIIEDYPEDKYSPSCLIYGHTELDRPLHVLCSSPPRVRVIMANQPDPEQWIDNKYRRSE